jgi:uncharacterized protein YjiS (DUF1127 family)
MTRLYLVTVAAVLVTTSLASNLLLAGSRGQVRPGLPPQLRWTARRGSRRIKRVVDGWVAGMIARRERQTAFVALHRLSDRELRDIGLCRDEIDQAVRNADLWLRAVRVGMHR